MDHGQGRDKGHEPGKSNKGPEKGQDKGREKKGKGKGKAKKGKGQGQGQGEGESFQGKGEGKGQGQGKGEGQGQGEWQQAKRKSRGSSEGQGLSPSPWTGGGEEAQGDKKGQEAKGEGKAPLTPEQVKQRSKQRREKWTVTERANTVKDPQGYRVPYYHRRQRVPPGKLRSITDKLVRKWKMKRVEEGALYLKYKHCFMTSQIWDEHKFQEDVQLMREEISRVFFFTRPP